MKTTFLLACAVLVLGSFAMADDMPKVLFDFTEADAAPFTTGGPNVTVNFGMSATGLRRP